MSSKTARSGNIIFQILLILGSLALAWGLGRLSISISMSPDIGHTSFRLIRVLAFLILPACYLLYFFAGRKLLNDTMPVLWLLGAIALKLAPLLTGGYSDIGNFIFRETIYLWAVICIVYFIEWVAITKQQRIVRKKVFSGIGKLGVVMILVFSLKIMGYDLFISHDDSALSFLPFICVYLLFGGYRLLNGFIGISEEKCDRYLGSHNEGSTKVFSYEKLTGDAAVLFGIRSVLIWLAVPVLILGWLTGAI
ncbi:MAG: hypothetical protein ACRCUT_09625 [Spirochaetota bacterium]